MDENYPYGYNLEVARFLCLIALIILLPFTLNFFVKSNESECELEEYKKMSKSEIKDSCIPLTKEIMRNESKNIGKMVSIELSIISNDVYFIGHDYKAICIDEEISDNFVLRYTENKKIKKRKREWKNLNRNYPEWSIRNNIVDIIEGVEKVDNPAYEKLLKNDKIRVYGIYNGEYTSIDGKDNGQSITIVDYEFIDKA